MLSVQYVQWHTYQTYRLTLKRLCSIMISKHNVVGVKSSSTTYMPSLLKCSVYTGLNNHTLAFYENNLFKFSEYVNNSLDIPFLWISQLRVFTYMRSLCETLTQSIIRSPINRCYMWKKERIFCTASRGEVV